MLNSQLKFKILLPSSTRSSFRCNCLSGCSKTTLLFSSYTPSTRHSLKKLAICFTGKFMTAIPVYLVFRLLNNDMLFGLTIFLSPVRRNQSLIDKKVFLHWENLLLQLRFRNEFLSFQNPARLIIHFVISKFCFQFAFLNSL